LRVTNPKPGEPIRLVSTKSGPRYRAVVDTGSKGKGRKQTTRTFATLAAARAWVDETRTEVRSGVFLQPTNITVRDLFEEWLGSKTDVRERTRYGYSETMKPVLRRLGDVRAQDVTAATVQDLMAWMAREGGTRGQGLGHRSLVYALTTIKQVFAYGVRTGVLRASPAAEVKPPRRRRGDKHEVATWTPEDLRKFMELADEDEWNFAWRLVVCGLRRSEVCGLTWPNVDLATGALRIVQGRVSVGGQRWIVDDPKSDASWRTVYAESLHSGSVALFKAAYLKATDKSGFVLTDALGVAPHPDTVTKRFRRLCADAQVPVIKPHALRHTLATIAHRNGAAPRDVARMLGHSVQVHLSAYLPGDEAGARAASEVVGKALAAKG
jgi:integrase